jgi:hypothetical protein
MPTTAAILNLLLCCDLLGCDLPGCDLPGCDGITGQGR